MRCRQAKKLLFEHIDGVISESDGLALERHLAGCRSCAAEASALSRSLELLHRLPTESPGENFNWKLRLRLAKAKNAWRGAAESERSWQGVWNARFAVGAASAFLVVVVAGAFVLGPVWKGAGGADRLAVRSETPLRGGSAPAGGGGENPTRVYTPFSLPFSDGFASRPVVSGPQGDWDSGPVDRTSGPVINADSLRVRFMESRIGYERIRRLEQQIELLNEELEKCSRQRGR